MAPKIPAVISCSSPVLLENELSDVRAVLELTETEDSWDKISNALLRLNALTIGSAANYPSELIAACKGFARPIINSLNSERSRLSGSATDLLATLATNLGRLFEALIPILVPTLLSLASRSNKIFIARAKACLLTIVENCQSPVILPLLRQAVSDKSVTLRLTATDLVMACLNCYNPPDLETPGRVDDIEAVIRATARDASADVRKSSRKVFEAYKILFPSRVDTFIGPLTPVMKKYLDIKAAAPVQRKPLLLSSSTSAPALPSSTHPTDTVTRSRQPVQRHVKSASTSSAVPSHVEKASRSAKPPSDVPVTESVSMPPPPERKPSSGPIRPPPSMRQAVAAAAAFAPSRPPFSRHALPTSDAIASDMTRSQPAPRGGAQRPTRAPAPSAPSPALDIAELAPKSLDADQPKARSTSGPRRVPKPEPVHVPAPAPSAPSPALDIAELAPKSLDADPPMKARSTSGPRRVPKPEPVPVQSVVPVPGPAPAPGQKRLDNLKDSRKEREREKAQFASSTSSSSSTLVNALARSRPPSRLASSTSSRVGEEKGRERDGEKKESRSRPASRMGGEFHPRPAPRTEKESHIQSEPKVDKDLQAGPTSGTEKEVHARPASRVERKKRARPESRAETEAARPTKEAIEQPQTRPGPQLCASAEAEAEDGESTKQCEARPSSKGSKERKRNRSRPANKKSKCDTADAPGIQHESESGERPSSPAAIGQDGPTLAIDVPALTTDVPTLAADMPALATDILPLTTDVPALATDTPTSTTEMSTLTTNMPAMPTDMPTNITFRKGSVDSSERAELLQQKGVTIWLTGLSASGKSTIACALEQHLLHLKKFAYRLDGDNIRLGLNKDLGFDEKSRNENMRRIGEVAKLFADAACICITAFISPYRVDRDTARALHAQSNIDFIEVFVDAPLSVVEARDPKGWYKKARAGEIRDFTGISAPYEEPLKPEIHIKTGEVDVDESVRIIAEYLLLKGYISSLA